MKISLQRVLNSRLGVGLALALGRVVPPVVGYRAGDIVAGRIASNNERAMVRAVRLNQWVVGGEGLSAEQLDCAVQAVFRTTAHCIYDLYHNIGSPRRMDSLIHYNPQAEEMIARTQEGKAGTVIVGVHMSNFDLVMQAAGMRGLKALTLAVPNPGGGYRWQNDLRREHGVEIVPASMASLKQAICRLEEGGSVLTGVDRPVPEPKYRPLFFGRPAALPVHHIHLALKARVPIYVFAAILEPDGRYQIAATDPIEMRHHANRQVEMLRNAEAVLEVAAGLIRRAPQQWSMFFPVWPEAMAEVP